MQLPRIEVRSSAIAGQGVFTLEPLRPGRIVCLWPVGAKLITEAQFLAGIAAEDPAITRTAIRCLGGYFVYTDQVFSTDYFNHSFEPNCLVHCGVVLCRHELPAGAELTVDYRTLVDATDLGVYHDSATGREIRGFTARETALRTARELIALLESQPDWEG